MKTLFRQLMIISILLLGLIPLTTSTDFDVKILYFKPTDVPDPDIDVAFHDRILKDIQLHYQSEMTRHGFDGKTFPLELNKDGDVVIYIINGNHDSEHLLLKKYLQNF